MTDITIPSGVTSIGGSAFYYCRSLSSATIPNNITTIGNSTFLGCESLRRLNSDTDGVFNLPSGVTSVGDSAFAGCTSLTSIDIPSGVTSIGIYAFDGCTSLTSVTINATTPPTLGDYALEGTPIASGTGYIYVPPASVSAYQSAWSTYTNQIRPIT